jgi:hypothetical protein
MIETITPQVALTNTFNLSKILFAESFFGQQRIYY